MTVESRPPETRVTKGIAIPPAEARASRSTWQCQPCIKVRQRFLRNGEENLQPAHSRAKNWASRAYLKPGETSPRSGAHEHPEWLNSERVRYFGETSLPVLAQYPPRKPRAVGVLTVHPTRSPKVRSRILRSQKLLQQFSECGSLEVGETDNAG